MRTRTLYSLAHEAVRQLALNVIAGKASEWKRIDRIEKRFRISGLGEAIVSQWQKQRAEFLQKESARHDAQNPDRLTFLHR